MKTFKELLIKLNTLNIAVVMWRFSIIIYIPITILMTVTVLPIRWLLTGKYEFKQKEFLIFYKWAKLIGF